MQRKRSLTALMFQEFDWPVSGLPFQWLAFFSDGRQAPALKRHPGHYHGSKGFPSHDAALLPDEIYNITFERAVLYRRRTSPEFHSRRVGEFLLPFRYTQLRFGISGGVFQRGFLWHA